MCRKDWPVLRQALERMHTARGKREAGASHQVPHRTGNQDLAWLCKSGDTCANVNGYAGNLLLSQIALARVQTCPDLKTKRLNGFTDRESAPNSAGWAIEIGQKSIAGG